MDADTALDGDSLVIAGEVVRDSRLAALPKPEEHPLSVHIGRPVRAQFEVVEDDCRDQVFGELIAISETAIAIRDPWERNLTVYRDGHDEGHTSYEANREGIVIYGIRELRGLSVAESMPANGADCGDALQEFVDQKVSVYFNMVDYVGLYKIEGIVSEITPDGVKLREAEKETHVFESNGRDEGSRAEYSFIGEHEVKFSNVAFDCLIRTPARDG